MIRTTVCALVLVAGAFAATEASAHHGRHGLYNGYHSFYCTPRAVNYGGPRGLLDHRRHGYYGHYHGGCNCGHCVAPVVPVAPSCGCGHCAAPAPAVVAPHVIHKAPAVIQKAPAVIQKTPAVIQKAIVPGHHLAPGQKTILHGPAVTNLGTEVIIQD